jgi:DNA repair exonuclease SbcCD nuclease subunit
VRVLLFSDLHAHAWKHYRTILPNGRNSRLQDVVNILQQIRFVADEENVDGILFAGDMFHIRPGLATMAIPTFNAVFAEIAQLKINRQFVGLLVGNHDQGDKAGREYSIYAFGSVVTVMDQPGWYTFISEEGEMLAVLAVPANDDREVMVRSIFSGIKERTENPILAEAHRHIMLGHFGIDGAIVGTNFHLRDDNLLRIEDLQNHQFDQIFLGDYHQPQVLAPNVRYLGATHHHNWGDVGSDGRGYTIWDSEQGTIESHELNSPKFVKVAYQGGEPPAEVVADNFVRILCHRLFTFYEQEQVKQLFVTAGARHVEFWFDSAPELTNKTMTFQPAMDADDMVEVWVEEKDPDHPELAIREGQEIMAEALRRYEE